MAILTTDEITALAQKTVREAAAENLNKEYRYSDGVMVSPEGYRGYKPEDIDLDWIPLSVDLVQFVIWLRANTDYFSGPELDIHFPEATSPEFLKVLGQNVIDYTGE